MPNKKICAKKTAFDKFMTDLNRKQRLLKPQTNENPPCVTYELINNCGQKSKSLFESIELQYKEVMQKRVEDKQRQEIKDLIKSEIQSKYNIFIKLLKFELKNLTLAESVIESIYLRERDKDLSLDFLNMNRLQRQIDYFVEHEGLLWHYNVIDYSQISENSELKNLVKNVIEELYNKNLDTFRNEFTHLYIHDTFTDTLNISKDIDDDVKVVDFKENEDSFSDGIRQTSTPPFEHPNGTMKNFIPIFKKDLQQFRKESSLGDTLESPELPSTPEIKFKPFM